ncbi:MAG: potassium channel family protein, partial [Thermodesulfovibrionales bacterium]|nr:potassium channel family protein [Thermodesulfovibrionales bacterium]
MAYEGKQFSWLTGLYWTLVTMTTLGFSDITFTSDVGRAFNVIILLSGVVFLLIMLPFTFIQFFYAPWLDAQTKARTPKSLPSDTKEHVIITDTDPISISLANKLIQYNYHYVFSVPDFKRAIELYYMQYNVVVGAVSYTHLTLP